MPPLAAAVAGGSFLQPAAASSEIPASMEAAFIPLRDLAEKSTVNLLDNNIITTAPHCAGKTKVGSVI
jgi:hypothetical protein